MGSEVTLSSAVRNNLLSLQDTARLLGQTQQRLATGKKVNSALDDPTAYFTASSLNSRAGDLNRLLDSVGGAVQTITAADQGIEAITKLVENAQAAARQALQSPAGATSAASAATVKSSITFAADDTASKLTGTGSIGADVAATFSGTAISADTAATATGSDLGAGTTDLNGLGSITDGQTFTIDVGGTSHTFEFDSDSTTTAGNTAIDISSGATDLDSLISQINTALGADATAADADGTSANGATSIQITAADNTKAITISGSAASVLSDLGLDGTGTGTATARTIKPTNATVAGLNGTLSIQSGSNSATTLDLSTVDSVYDLKSQLTSLSGGALSVDASGKITASSTANTDDLTFSVSGASGANTNASVLQSLGIGDGTSSSKTVEATNSTLSGFVPGENTLSFSVGGTTSTITFGSDDSSGQVNTRDELVNAALANGVKLSFDAGGNLSAQAANVSDGDISVSGASAVLNSFGFTAGATASTTNSALSALTQSDFSVAFGSSAAQTIDFSSIGSVSQLDTALSNITGGTASRDSSGAITFTADNETDTVTIGGTVTGTGVSAGASDPTAASQADSAARTAAENQFNSLLDQIDQLSNDASYNGNNLLKGDSLQVIFNEDGSSKLSVKGVDFSASGLGISKIAGGDFQSNDTINSTLDKLGSAIGSLRQQSSTFGSNLSVVQTRQDFTKNLINTLQTGASNLTLADTNEEGANLLALQTRQSLSTTALSLASQADQNVLRLVQ